jgi:hypothetical protein
MAAKRPSNAILWLTIPAAPVALGLETALRLWLFPDDFELVRELLRPMLTPVAWVFGALAALAGLGGLALQRRLSAKRLAKFPPGAPLAARHGAVTGVFLLTSSVPQIPAVLATLTYMFGASLVPVLVGVGLCTAGVVGQALRVPSLAAEAPATDGSTSAP